MHLAPREQRAPPPRRDTGRRVYERVRRLSFWTGRVVDEWWMEVGG